ncbi:HAD-IIIC family phosphatase [Polyangium sp. y55x31]|uniref:HAD-IIIC family phosphatase n=1 Tax=Polyangium sp. y55x31 TaxID=3042688 RepID=UPI0024827B86|nr:HAD-IIIC family phosphatase [Polyangium sp. y55x31]MDI1475023.1 HAD-IIIC family phosphatase [Polyangium sp. y55x31]
MSKHDEEGIKCVVWDLDNTLWDGVLVESGALTLKPEIARIIRVLDERGILQSVASKNNFDDAAAKLRELGLWEYFLYPEIHWGAKSESIARIQKVLNIGMNTILFVDDDPFERDEVAKANPDVNVAHADSYATLLEDRRMIPRFITADSARRRQMYREDEQRKRAEETFDGPKETFLSGLGMRFKIAEAQGDDLARAAELTVRTHQLNATGRTYSYDELDALRRSDSHKLYICEMTDVYGSYGKIGLSLVERTESAWYVRLLLMSCRVMSRGVGTVLLGFLMQEAKRAGVRLFADFVPTDRNRAMYVAFKFNGFRDVGDGDTGARVLEANLEQIQNFPGYIEVVTP